ncbi:MAG: glycosyltransferase family 4 protein [Chloroflexi bacterium]|nr:glycosyltransferase family 4 protein [Chloroflexota bacterium]
MEGPLAHPRDVKVLIISHDVVGTRMAGPGIRSWELARVLSQVVQVTLAVPGETDLTSDGVAVRPYRPDDIGSVAPLVEQADVVMPCGWTLQVFAPLFGGERPIIVDGYDPHVMEALVQYADLPFDQQEAHQQSGRSLLHQQCTLGDFFICASERQRDWWLGLLSAHDRVNPRTYAADPTLRSLVDVVPFGVPPRRPERSRSVMKGVVPGIARDDRIVLWGGGIWEWLDPLTLIRAMSIVARERGDVRVVFPGANRPQPRDEEDMPMWQRAVDLAQQSDLLGRYVFFGEWVDYTTWQDYLLEADIGVSLHFDTLETHLAFRTRVLSYIWASLPVILTRGDVLSNMVAEHELGVLVDYQDAEGVAAAILALLREPADRRESHFEEARRELHWERVAEPLVRFCREPHRAADRVSGGPTSVGAEGYGWSQLHREILAQEEQIEHLQALVAGYEKGRFIRLMKWLHRLPDLRRS